MALASAAKEAAAPANLPAPLTKPTVLVVRRSTMAVHGGRAILNHDEMLLGLRQLLPPGIAIEEYPPSGLSLAQSIHMWASASVAICTHGAATTNMIFMPRNSTIVEILAAEQRGRVYKAMAHNLGHRYFNFTCNRTEARARSQLPFARRQPYISYMLDVPWLLSGLRDAGALDALPGVSWRTIDARALGLEQLFNSALGIQKR